jgi:long-subunit fatty acid transport protein
MKKSILIISTILIALFSVNAQSIDDVNAQKIDEETGTPPTFYEKYLKNKLYTGGGAGISFGTVVNVSLNPILGYRFNEKVQAGVGINYQYIKDRYWGVEYSSYGTRAFAKYHIIPQAYVVGEYSFMNIEYANRATLERIWVPSLLIGAGYKQALGAFSSYNLEMLYNIFDSRAYPVGAPIIRAGINIGL